MRAVDWSPTQDELASVERFAEMAERFVASYERQSGSGYLLRTRAAAAVRLLGDGPGRLLDAGMGPGGLLRALRGSAWTVWGIDASPRMVEFAAARLPDAAERLSVARIEELPFADRSFDAVAALGVVEYVNTARAVSELARVLAPGGLAVVSLRSRSLQQRWRSNIVRPVAQRSPGSIGQRTVRRRPLARRANIEQLFAEAGLSVERVEPAACNVLPEPLDRAFPELESRLATRAESARPRVRSLLALQILVAASRQ